MYVVIECDLVYREVTKVYGPFTEAAAKAFIVANDDKDVAIKKLEDES